MSKSFLEAPMPTRPMGRMNWQASRFALGGVKYDTQLEQDDVNALVNRTLDLGVNVVDTAFAYGGGASETKLGIALEGRRKEVFLCSKTIDRSYDGAMFQMETSFQRLKTDVIDLMYLHGIDNEDEYQRSTATEGSLKAIAELRDAGRIRHIGLSGHWVRHIIKRLVQEYPFDAILVPVGVFNHAYDYRFVDTVVPTARERGMAIMGMKVLGAGRARHAASIEPYLRYSLGQDVDSLVIGVDSIRDVEQIVEIVKSGPAPLTDEELAPIAQEALAISQEWGQGEFPWVHHYTPENRAESLAQL